MPNEPLEGAALPQEDWNPPGGELDFDALFGGAGDGSSDIIQVEESRSQTVEPTQTAHTEPENQSTEPQESQTPQVNEPVQRTYVQDPNTGVFLRTKTGKSYKSADEAIAGIEEADKTIENLRKMVEAVTGPVSLKKLNQHFEDSQVVSYMQNPERYAKDKEQAVIFAQRTGDWSRYRDVEGRLMDEKIEQRIGQYAPVVQKMGRSEALEATAKDIPDFKTFYGTEEYTRTLESRPKLKQAVEYAETQPALQADLSELYKSVWDANVSRKLPELLKQPQSSTSQTPPRMPMGKSTMTAPKVVTERNQSPGAQRDMSNSAGRKALIAELEAKGILDRPL